MTNIISSNYITKSWFYIIDENTPCIINIVENIYVSILLLDSKNQYTINLEMNSKVDFYSFLTNYPTSQILFNQIYDNSILKVKILFFCKNINLTSNVRSYINSNKSKSFIDITSIIQNNKLHIDSSIEIDKNLSKVNAYLKQKNIFLWDNWSVRGLPTLFVKSEDVKVSHSCQIDKIDNEKLFYLNSRWIDENNAKFILTKSYFVKTFSCIFMFDKDIYNNLYNEFLKLSN